MIPKYIAAGLLAVSCFSCAGAAVLPSIPSAEASAIKSRTYSTDEGQKRDVKYLKQHTVLSQDEIVNMMALRYEREDIENLYILHTFLSKKTYSEIQNMYRAADKDIETVLEDQKIDKDQFYKLRERTFPKEDTDFDRVQRIKNLRHQPV